MTEEVMWGIGPWPVTAAIRCSKVHRREPGACVTACGRLITAKRSKIFTTGISPHDPRCIRCQQSLS